MGNLEQKFTAKDVEIKDRELKHDGFFRIEKVDLKQKLFNGGWSSVYAREIMVKPPAVAVLPYDPNKDQVVLIEQFRIGAVAQDTTPWLIEIVAGIIDSTQESEEEIVRRELKEEACLDAEELLPIYDYFSSPGGSTERIKMFCAKVDASQAGTYCGLQDENEDIKVHVISTKDAFAALHSGQIYNAFSIIALQWLELNLERLNKQWLVSCA